MLLNTKVENNSKILPKSLLSEAYLVESYFISQRFKIKHSMPIFCRLLLSLFQRPKLSLRQDIEVT
ncbi:hypothetical protein Xvie_03800 [Xenorhabdus vietnamensis]|uniref:Uncharacterized protein n=1 Tax=Xenorhabdus vietnamensis TaxID=351656 RepID=A0A1Y2S6T4_9GAMM|nr:hypothetical protein Xvie_03800 [Xenorhabdus vietnamensis]